MPVSFSKLRIIGFKSFAEPTGVDILPGLTGIVGPNGKIDVNSRQYPHFDPAMRLPL